MHYSVIKSLNITREYIYLDQEIREKEKRQKKEKKKVAILSE